MENNEIIINEDTTLTVCGPLANKLYFANGCDIPAAMRSKSNRNIAFVVELDGTLRAAQESRENALHYMNDTRILITREIPQGWFMSWAMEGVA